MAPKLSLKSMSSSAPWRLSLLCGLAAVGTACTHTVAAEPDFSALEGLRFGISVTDLNGEVLIAHRADERFAPASNVKLFTTAAAFAAKADITALQPNLRVAVEPSAEPGLPTLRLVGRGDPAVGFGPDCEERCVEDLAAQVAASGIKEVADIIGDDRWFADERRPLGWTWDDLKFGHGTSISALAVNDNVLPLKVSPSKAAGRSVHASWVQPGPAYFQLDNQAETGAKGRPTALRLERRLGEETARLYGELPVGRRPLKLDLGVDDPAHLAAWYFQRALRAEGVRVAGDLKSEQRPLQYQDEPTPSDPNDPASAAHCQRQPDTKDSRRPLASLTPAPVEDIVETVNRDSQNLYAEVLLRQLGRAAGRGSSFCGRLQVQLFLDEVGVPRTSYDLIDGSGLSSYNRATPATITTLLRHAAAAPWGETYRESLPVGGSSVGTLKYRFRGTPLEGKIFAKTGTLNHVDALSGYLIAKSGRTLVFSIIVNDRPLDTPSAMGQIESTLLKLAAQY